MKRHRETSNAWPGTPPTFAILGPVELRSGGRSLPVGGPRQHALLAFLLLHANRPVSTGRLHEALWSEQEPGGAMKRVHMAIARLRRTLEPVGDPMAVLRRVGGGYALNVAAGELDADRFGEGVARGKSLLRDGDPGQASETLRATLALWRAAPLADVAGWDFACAEIRRLEELHLEALDARIEADLALGRHDAVVGELTQLGAREPLSERICRQLMLALYRSGRQVEALDAHQRLRAGLFDELGIEPGPELQSLQRAILEHAGWLSLDAPPAECRIRGPLRASAPSEPSSQPAALRSAEREPFVGRACEIAQLHRCYERVAAGDRQVVVLSGEPGVGKSRLAREFARQAAASGAVVLYGRSEEEALLPHEPFVEALREYVRGCDAGILADQIGPTSGELRRVVPELAARVPALAHPLPGEPDGARYRLFDAMAGLLCEIGHREPLVLVLDDLHWADPGTLLLLKYVARYRCAGRLMIVGTYRDMDLEPGHPLTGILAELAREGLCEQLTVGGLDEGAVDELVASHTANRASAQLRRLVFRQTEGNAFFVVEALRHLTDFELACDGVAAEPVLPLSDGVRMLVGCRLERLGPRVGGVLAAAAVQGQEFELEVVERVCDASPDELVDAVERAVRGGIVAESAGRPGFYAFGHALIRDVQYELLTAARRALTHRRVAEAIEELHASDPGPNLARLAHHFGLGGSREAVAKAIGYATRAGARDAERLAYERAAGHYRHALDLLDAHWPAERAAERCELVIARGEVERMAGHPAHRDTLLLGARLARQLDDVGLLARAARANNRGLFSSSQGVDHERVAVLQAALDALDAPESATRARLLAQLAVELIAGAEARERSDLADQAVAMARRVGDHDTLAHALAMRALARCNPHGHDDRDADAVEAWQLAEHGSDRVLAARVAYVAFDVAMTAGDLDRADLLLRRLGDLADELGQPIIAWNAAVSRAKRCLVDGSPRRAEQLGFVAHDIGRRAAQPDVDIWFLGTIFVARFLRGTLDAGEPDLTTLFEQPGSAPEVGGEFTPGRSIPLLVTAAKSAILCEVGRPDDARVHFEVLVGELADVPNDFATLPLLAYGAIACAHLRDARRARRLLALMRPHADRFINIGGAWFGAVAHHLALLQATAGAARAAAASFDAAERAYEALGAGAWLTRCRLDRATVLPGESDELLEQVVASSRELGLDGIEARAAAMLGEPVAA